MYGDEADARLVSMIETTETGTTAPDHHQPKVYDLFLAVVAVIALAVVIWQFFLSPDEEISGLLRIFDYIFCGVFFIDYIRQIVVAKHKWRYIFTWGLLDLASSIPTVGEFRFFRAAQIIRALKAVRSIRILSQVLVRDRMASAVSLLLIIGIVIVVGSCICVLHFELSVVHGNIKSAEDVAWWAFETTSTVGYGDFYPVTSEGRVLAVLVMCVGIGLFATFAGALAGLFMRKPKDHVETVPEHDHGDQFAALKEQNRLILQRLTELESKLGPRG